MGQIYILYFWTSGISLYTSDKIHWDVVPACRHNIHLISRTYMKTYSWNSKIDRVNWTDVYLDVLVMGGGPIIITTIIDIARYLENGNCQDTYNAPIETKIPTPKIVRRSVIRTVKLVIYIYIYIYIHTYYRNAGDMGVLYI
jgi:hypothetical protein